MHSTEWRTFAGLAVLLVPLVLLGLAACGQEPSREDAAAVAPSASAVVPADLLTLLEHHETHLHAVDPSRVGIDAAAAVATFLEQHGGHRFPVPPTAYAVEIDRSAEARLPAGITAWMLHVPGVPRDVRPPLDVESGSTPAATTVQTDVFAFVDGRSGALLLTTYLAGSGT